MLFCESTVLPRRVSNNPMQRTRDKNRRCGSSKVASR
jgi:hypothetical protein